jgi:hypothetical protein
MAIVGVISSSVHPMKASLSVTGTVSVDVATTNNVSIPVTVTGGSGGYTYSLRGAPSGFSMSGNTIVGNTRVAGTYSGIHVTVRDINGNTTDTNSITLIVNNITYSVSALFAGGGGGSGPGTYMCGGGAGGYKTTTLSITTNSTYSFTVGNGGSAGGGAGTNTVWQNTTEAEGAAGVLSGNDGPNSAAPTSHIGGSGSPGLAGGGGGGAGGNGTNAYGIGPNFTGWIGGNGGAGRTNSITGSTVYYCYGGSGHGNAGDGDNGAPTDGPGCGGFYGGAGVDGCVILSIPNYIGGYTIHSGLAPTHTYTVGSNKVYVWSSNTTVSITF